MRIQRKGKSLILLVGMELSIVTLENSMEDQKKLNKNRTNILFHHIAKINKIRISKTPIILCLLPCCPQRSRSDYITNNDEMSKENLMYMHSIIVI